MKKQTYEQKNSLRFSLRVSKRLKRNHALAWLNVRYWVFVFSFDAGRSMLNVHLANQDRVVGQRLLGNFDIVSPWFQDNQFRACEKDPEAAPILIDKYCE